jgi:hypothetical protein
MQAGKKGFFISHEYSIFSKLCLACLDCQIMVYMSVSADTKTCGSPLNTCHFYGD